MIQIKFRIWNENSKKIQYSSFSIVFDGHGEIKDIYNTDYACVKIMQFIGRKDIENKDIYEEDILECDYDDFWDPHSNDYPHPKKKYRFIMRGKDFMDFPDMPRCVKVIGNKFENPKLYVEVERYDDI